MCSEGVQTGVLMVAPRRRRLLSWIRFVVGLGLAGLAMWVLLGRRGELSGAGSTFAHIRDWWLVPAVAVEAFSFFCFAQVLGRLLLETDHRLALRPLLGITLASNAVANSLPAGPAFGAVYSYRQMTLRGIPSITSAWAMLASGVLATSGLAVLATIGVGAAEDQSDAFDLVGVVVGSLVVAALLVLLLRRPQVLSRPVHVALRAGRRAWPSGRWDPDALTRSFRQRLAAVTPGWPGLLTALAWAIGNWVFDLGCLLCTFGAVGQTVPWAGVVLAYGAAQLAANLPVTPGGLGVVEGSLTIGLVAYGGAEAKTVAIVIIYRVLSFWVPLLIGWVVVGAMAAAHRRAIRRVPVPAAVAPAAVAPEEAR